MNPLFVTKQLVQKKTGYTFIGRVVSRYEVDGGIRYDVQVDAEVSIKRLHEMMREKKIVIQDATTLIEIEDLMRNCHGMVHIFSEEQLKEYSS